MFLIKKKTDNSLKKSSLYVFDSSRAIFSHIDSREQSPDHLLIEICYGTTLQKLTNDDNILRKCIMYHIPSSRHIDIATFCNNNRPTRLSHRSLSSCTRTLASKVFAENKSTIISTYNVIFMLSSRKTRALLQAYLILTAADLWNKQKIKSKEDAGTIIRKLKEIPCAGCIYTIKDFKKIFDEMRTYL